ncbi:MAG TPA: hypothetical protein GX532_01410 [Clostridia bacterium]|nr:flagellar brake domain-containing protein [Clostridia bacterium]HHY05622.1 hypothetical protein [Clostridia bacterium]
MYDLKKLLKINQLIQIEVISKTGESVRYASRIENIIENFLTLVAPMKERQPLVLTPGTPFNIWFWNKEAVYVFRTYLRENVEATVPRIIVTYPETIKRVQKREFVRVGLVMEVLLSYFNPLGEEEVFYCKARDISGGGMMLVLNTYVPLRKGCKISVQFLLQQTLLNIPGVIVWNEWELDSAGIERNLIGVQFTDITEKDRKIIIKTVYQRQIELKRKGLL